MAIDGPILNPERNDASDRCMITTSGFNGVRLIAAAMVFSAVTLWWWRLASLQSPDLAQGAVTPSSSVRSVSALNRARAFATATHLSTGTILVTGGIDTGYNYLATVELYDPALQRFTTIAPMTTPRASHTATELANGQVLIAGGVACNDGKCNELASAEIFDPVSQQFLPTGSMASPRSSHTATLLGDGTVLIAGGSDGEGLASAEIYDPASGRFVETAVMTTPRFLHSATLMNDGQVLIAGGRSCIDKCNDNAASTSAELYDPSRRQFFPVGSMREGRILHSSTLLPDGRVLICGGRSCSGDCEGDKTLQTAEIYDPVSGKFLAGGTMSNARSAHEAVQISSGQVFLFGGVQCTRRSGCAYLNTGDLFDPASNQFFPTANGTVAGINLVAAPLGSEQVLVAGGSMRGTIRKTANVFSFAAQ